jgi:hypothetical protein
MIAKSPLVVLIFSLLILSCEQGTKQVHIKNKFALILDEYDIHPPHIEYGCPLWYQDDTLQPTAVVFLKNDLSDLHKIDKITYVAEPTKENAEIIFNFSGDLPTGRFIPFDLNPEMKFVIVPDSNLTYYQVRDFMEYLTPPSSTVEFLIVSTNQRYHQILFQDLKISDEYMPIPGCFANTNFLTLMFSVNHFFIEGETSKKEDISEIVYQFYSENFLADKNYKLPDRHRIEKKEVTQNIDLFESLLKDAKPDEREIYFEELQKWKSLDATVDKYGTLNLLSEYDQIHLSIIGNTLSVGVYVELLDSINCGLYQSRTDFTRDFFGESYFELLESHRVEDLNFVSLLFPNRVVYTFNEWINIPPPPSLDLLE